MNQIINADCFDILKTLETGSVDAVITDPPYGINLSHWDKPIDTEELTKEAKRITTDFYVFFGQMPTVFNPTNMLKIIKIILSMLVGLKEIQALVRGWIGHMKVFISTLKIKKIFTIQQENLKTLNYQAYFSM